jgi:glycosyltransferase involved in cell wall biosynthesis
MPAYNSRAYIEASIQSVLDQDYEAIELIVVDDGSSDGTPDLARAFGARVQVIEQRNSGPAAARNNGVTVARGQYLAFIDADDIWLPGKVKAQVRHLAEHPDTGIVFGRWIRWNASPDGSFSPPPTVVEDNSGPPVIPELSGWIYPELLLDSVVWIVSCMLRKSIWETLGGLDTALRVGEDYDFFLRASRISKIDKLSQTVAYYRIHTQSTTHVVRSEDYETLVLERTLGNFGTNGPDGRPVSTELLNDRLFKLSFDHGYRHFHSGDPRVAYGAFRKALRYGGSSSWKAAIYLLLSKKKSWSYKKM